VGSIEWIEMIILFARISGTLFHFLTKFCLRASILSQLLLFNIYNDIIPVILESLLIRKLTGHVSFVAV
jgi:hypothetical protein